MSASPVLIQSARYCGPERRAHPGPRVPPATQLPWPQSILDELDYGILLLSADQHLMLLNRAARLEMDAQHPLQLRARVLHTREPDDASALHEALYGATHRGLRRLVTLGRDGQRISLAVVPLGSEDTPRPMAVMVILGKRQVCERLSMQWFAKEHGLTPAEQRVLERLCAGDTPRQIATLQEVGLATVRTQIGSIRTRTGASSIRELVQHVAMLPPMMNRIPGGWDGR